MSPPALTAPAPPLRAQTSLRSSPRTTPSKIPQALELSAYMPLCLAIFDTISSVRNWPSITLPIHVGWVYSPTVASRGGAAVGEYTHPTKASFRHDASSFVQSH